MAALLAVDAMDARLMRLATLAISAERLAPDGARVAKWIGTGPVVIGSVLMARAFSLG